MPVKTTVDLCLCGNTLPFKHCCQPLLNGKTTAKTALALMRSRYSAYALSEENYLLNTWHSTTRPNNLELQHSKQQWIRLKIISSSVGQNQDNVGEVEFIATYKSAGKAQHLHERSRFSREDGEWRYIDGVHD